jgi:hypothetical protein
MTNPFPCYSIGSDGDSKLIICDQDKKLKVYKGTSLSSETALLDSPVAMNVIYTETSMVKLLCLQVVLVFDDVVCSPVSRQSLLLLDQIYSFTDN